MSRPLRIEYEDAIYHVMNRGINHQNIFLNNYHREIFLNLLEEISIKFYIEIHSFCLMDNHYHLLIRTRLPNLGKAMRYLNGLYTRRFNVNENRDGSIFRGRYKAILIEKEEYLLQVSRYIHLNPLEAKLCQNPIEYVWSSYPAFINKTKKQHWLKTDLILSYFDNLNSYRNFVDQGNDDDTENFYHKPSCIFGSEEFINQLLFSVPQSQKKIHFPDIKKTIITPKIRIISESVAEYFSMNVEDLKVSIKRKRNLPRKLAILISRQYGQCSYQEISTYFESVSPSSLSTIIHRIEHEIKTSQMLQSHLKKILEIIFNPRFGT